MHTEDIFHLGVKALLRNENGNILLLQVNPEKLHGERKSYWDLPGGRVQTGDTVIDTLRRELTEEIDVTEIENPKELGMVLANIRIPLDGHMSAGLILDIYTCEIKPNIRIKISDEHVAYDWFTPKKAAELLRIKYPEKFCDIIAAI